MQDLRALKLLENLTDRETVLELISEVEDFTAFPKSNQYLVDLREHVNQKIQSMIKKQK